jgi:hypothetical protein
MMQEDTGMSYEAAITVGNRKAGDSIDFHVRHGRALHARAAREGLAALLSLLRSSRGHPVSSGPGWHVEWPVEPQGSHCGRP